MTWGSALFKERVIYFFATLWVEPPHWLFYSTENLCIHDSTSGHWKYDFAVREARQSFHTALHKHWVGFWMTLVYIASDSVRSIGVSELKINNFRDRHFPKLTHNMTEENSPIIVAVICCAHMNRSALKKLAMNIPIYRFSPSIWMCRSKSNALTPCFAKLRNSRPIHSFERPAVEVVWHWLSISTGLIWRDRCILFKVGMPRYCLYCFYLCLVVFSLFLGRFWRRSPLYSLFYIVYTTSYS